MATTISTLLAAFILLAASNSAVEAQRKQQLKHCKFDHLLDCFYEPIAYFTNQPNRTGMPLTEEEMEQYCFNTHDYLPYCATKWLHRCGNELHLDIARKVFLKPMQDSLRQFCASNGTIRPTFLKHVSCLNAIKLTPIYRTQCVRPLQANKEYVHSMNMKSPNLTSFVRGVCCAFNHWENCIVGFLRDRCGTESAGTTISSLVHHLTTYLLKDICSRGRFDPEDPVKCPPVQFQAPVSYQPKGLGHGSLFSHLFSSICPNVGWGVIPMRDF